MNNLKQQAESLFNNPLVEESINKHNQQAWLAAMEYLGDKHILAIKIERKESGK